MLTRIIGKSIMIGDDIEVVVLDIKGRSVCIGVRAPREIAVDREEIFQRKQKEKARLAYMRRHGDGTT